MGSAAVLVANRGEIAVRLLQAAAEAGLRTVAVYADDDAAARHVQLADEAKPLGGTGPAAYLDADAVLAAARRSGCELVHPGYGFLSEDADFAERCAEAGLRFVGPSPRCSACSGTRHVRVRSPGGSASPSWRAPRARRAWPRPPISLPGSALRAR